MELFLGVIEDVNDPIQAGRVRVRIFRDHTDDKVAIPTESLPWAPTMLPTTSPSISGKGHTPFLVTGSWVVGFYTDSQKQSPIVMGSLPGFPTVKIPAEKGFSDPSAVYPIWTNDSDISYAAREEMYEQHPAYLDKVAKRHTNVQTAAPARVSSVAPDRDDTFYEEVIWDEPDVMFENIPLYPDNHVYETEAGHLQEFDDSEGSVRYHRYHPAGTYEEIVNDGSRTIKVIGDDYELILKNKNIYINGNVNMTCTGDMRQLVGGNYHLEVEKDYTVNVKGSMQSAININYEQEIGKTRSVSIGESDYLYVVVDQIQTIVGDKTLSIGGNNVSSISGNDSGIVIGNRSLLINGNHGMTNVGTLTLTSKGNITFDTTSNLNIAVDANLAATIGSGTNGGTCTVDSSGNMAFTAPRIDWN